MDQQDKKPAIDRAERQTLLDEIHRRFDIQLLWYDKGRSSCHRYRDDVTIHWFFALEEVTDELKRDIRRWVESQGWQFSRQMVKVLPNDPERIEYIYLAPMIPVALEVALTLLDVLR